MLSLETIQESLLDSIFGGKGNLAFIKANGLIKAEHRLRVHQDTVFENFVTALKILLATIVFYGPGRYSIDSLICGGWSKK